MTARRPVRLVVGLAAAGLLFSAGPALAAVNPPTSPAWSATGTLTTILRDATTLGAPPAATPVPVSISLSPRDPAGLAAVISDEADPASASYHHYLTPATFAARFGASSAQIEAVTSYLRSEGLSSITVGTNHLTVSAQATAATAVKAFHTSLSLFSQGGRTVLANTAPALVPQSLGGIVDGVIGLNQAQSAHAFTTTSALSPTAYNPPALATAYDATSLPAATGTSIAILAEGNLTQVVKDLRTEEAANHLPQVPVTIVATGAASTDTSGTDEWDLDAQTSTAMAGNVKMLYLYDAPSLNDPDIVKEVEAFASQDKAPVGSASFGECDAQAIQDGTAKAVDAALAEAVAQGQTFFASSGDSGSSCSVDSGPLLGLLPSAAETSYPASGTYTTGVGGTTLVTADGSYAGETAWADSGGGLSSEPAGSWTTSATSAARSAVSSSGGGLGSLLQKLGLDTAPTGARGVPDIAMDADPDTGANIVVDNQVETVGGTSLSSPLALGAWARIQNVHGDALGDAALALYGLYNAAHPAGTAPGATPGLHDIVAGSNGAYNARVGYDLVTGLGSIDVAALNRDL